MQVAQNYITYLGIKIGRNTGSIYPLNYPPLFDKIMKEFKKWEYLPFWPMSIGQDDISFARLLYKLQTIPILLRLKDVNIVI